MDEKLKEALEKAWSARDAATKDWADDENSEWSLEDYRAAAVETSLAASGFKVVPVEPTNEMIDALYGPWLSSAADETRRQAYRAMLTAYGEK